MRAPRASGASRRERRNASRSVTSRLVEMGDEGYGEPRPAEVRGGAALDSARAAVPRSLRSARSPNAREGWRTRRCRDAARRCGRRRRRGHGRGKAVLDVAPHVLLQDPALRPVPVTSERSAPSSRANRRTEGVAWNAAVRRPGKLGSLAVGGGRRRVPGARGSADAPARSADPGLDRAALGRLRGWRFRLRLRLRCRNRHVLRLRVRGAAAGCGGGGPARWLVPARRHRRRGLLGRIPRPLLARIRRIEHQQHVPLGDLVPEIHPELRDHPRGRGGDVHRRLVALQGEEGVVVFDPVPGGDQKLDHRDAGEVPDVRDRDLDPLSHARRRSSRPSSPNSP